MSKKLSPYSNNNYDDTNENTTWFKMLHMVPKGSKVLDIGCSTGQLGREIMQRRQASVWGIDITKADVERADKILEAAEVFDVETGNFKSSSIMSKKYDVVIFADVLEHMKDPVKVLERVKDILLPGGRIVYSIPNMAHMFVRLQLMAGKFRYTETGLLDYTHLHFYDDEEVERIFKDAGYAIAYADSTTFDYPTGLLKEKLAELGLEAKDKFLELSQTKQAIIFEYVGWAEVVDNKKRKMARPTDTSSPVDDVLAYVQRIKDAHKSEIASMKKKQRMTDMHVEKLEQAVLDSASHSDYSKKLIDSVRKVINKLNNTK